MKVPLKVEDAVLVAALIVTDHQPVDVRADLEGVPALDPGHRFSQAVVQIVLDDVRSVTDESAAGCRSTRSIAAQIDIRQRVVARTAPPDCVNPSLAA